MPPSIGPPATVREVPNGGNACAHAPFGPPSRIPLHTFGPVASSEPSALKQESDAPAGLLPPTPSSGFACDVLQPLVEHEQRLRRLVELRDPTAARP